MERLEFLDMTQCISPGGSGLGLLPFAAFIKGSARGQVQGQLIVERHQLWRLLVLLQVHRRMP
jgi:hypothetical protein